MDCTTARELMLEFVEGTLPARVAGGVKEHIEGCAECMRELEKQSSRTRVLQSLGRVKAPDQWEEISRSIRGGAPARRGVGLGVMIAIAAAIAAAVIITVLLLGSGDGQDAARALDAGETPAAQSP